jgi:hypothetical protein
MAEDDSTCGVFERYFGFWNRAERLWEVLVSVSEEEEWDRHGLLRFRILKHRGRHKGNQQEFLEEDKAGTDMRSPLGKFW